MTSEQQDAGLVLSAEEREAVRVAARIGIGTMPGSYVRTVEEAMEPVVVRIVAARVKAARADAIRQAAEYDEAGMPRHLPMGVNAQGQGPVEPDEPHHRVCWCMYPECYWTKALAAERAEERERIARAIHAAKPRHLTRDYTPVDQAYDEAARIARTT